MYKRQTGRAAAAVRAALAMIPLAACEGGWFDRASARGADCGVAAPRNVAAGHGITALTSSVEQRHFDFYTRYRATFDSMAGASAGSSPAGGFSQDAPEQASGQAPATCVARVFGMEK